LEYPRRGGEREELGGEEVGGGREELGGEEVGGGIPRFV